VEEEGEFRWVLTRGKLFWVETRIRVPGFNPRAEARGYFPILKGEDEKAGTWTGM
jgi:hypothetical protein